MIVLDMSGVFSVMALAIPAGVIYFLMAMIWPNGYSKCLGRFQDAGGSANALVSGLFIIVSALFSAVASLLQSPTAWPMWVLYTFVTAATLVLFVGFLREEKVTLRVCPASPWRSQLQRPPRRVPPPAAAPRAPLRR